MDHPDLFICSFKENSIVPKRVIKSLHGQLSSETRGLKFGLGLHLCSYFVCVSRAGPGEPVLTARI